MHLTGNKIFHTNPIGESEELLLIFDGLDEIMQQGKASLAVASDFVDQTQQLLRDHNARKLQLRVLITGRDLPVQAVESTFRKTGQILHVLPYYTPEKENKKHTYKDPANLLADDKREQWWRRYGALTGKGYTRLPEDLKTSVLDDITAQPLLNYLLAFSYDRGKIKFSKDSNLNVLYDDLIDSVFARDWEASHTGHRTVAGKISKSDYERVLEEIAVAAWQGPGRTATVKAIEERCEKGNLKSFLNEFQDKAREGVTNLLTAFYFRQSGSLDGDKTFEFTHKSFGEYLAAKRIVRQLKNTKNALQQADIGWTPEIALEKWIQLCSVAPMDGYIFKFLRDEVRRRDKDEVRGWQKMLCGLISYMLKNGMPVDSLPCRFQEKMRQSRNSEEGLLAALSACSHYTDEVSHIEWPEETSAGEWLSRLCGQRGNSHKKIFSLSCLNHLDFSNCILNIRDLYSANLYRCQLSRASLFGAHLMYANLHSANLHSTELNCANLNCAKLHNVNLCTADLYDADLRYADLCYADLCYADLRRADLRDTDLHRADLRYADLHLANLHLADLRDANLRDANLRDADLRGAALRGADLRNAKIDKANLKKLIAANIIDKSSTPDNIIMKKQE